MHSEFTDSLSEFPSNRIYLKPDALNLNTFFNPILIHNLTESTCIRQTKLLSIANLIKFEMAWKLVCAWQREPLQNVASIAQLVRGQWVLTTLKAFMDRDMWQCVVSTSYLMFLRDLSRGCGWYV